jgi:hypothetical protein
MCGAADGCCPMGCNHGTDMDCSPSCGDGVLSGTEACEPGSTEHPCPVVADCDDRDVCTEDSVTGSAHQCSAKCAYKPLTRRPIECDDGNPCTDDERVESTRACTFECVPSEPRRPTGSCVDDNPCTDDTPRMSTARCAYECPHDPAPVGTPCGNGMMCNASGRCEAPPARCGDGTLTPPEECDPAAPSQVAGYSCNTSCRRLNKLTPCNGDSQCEASPAGKCDIPGICRPHCSAEGALCEILPGATRNESTCTNGGCTWLCTVYEGVDVEHCGPSLWCDGTYCRVKP